MGSSSIIIELKAFFPETSASQVIPALRQDALVWAALQDEALSGLAMSELGTAPNVWTPTNLALLSLGYELRDTDLRNSPKNLPEDLDERAQTMFESFQSGTYPKPELKLAFLIALALTDKPKQWASLSQSALSNTVLSCLYSLIPNTADLLEAISLDQIVHMLLSHPLSEKNQIEILIPHLDSAPADQRLSILNILQSQRPKLADTLTAKLWESFSEEAPQRKVLNSSKGVTSRLTPPINQLHNLVQQADFQRLTANPEDARTALSSAQETVEQIQITLAFQAALAAIEAKQPDDAISIWHENSPQQPFEHSADIALALFQYGFSEEALAFANSLDEQNFSKSVTGLVLKARLVAQRKDLAEARSCAKEALKLSQANEMHLVNEDALTALLLDLNLSAEAISFATRILDEQPNSAEAAQIMSQAHHLAGTPEQALTWSSLAVTLDPDDLEHRRMLASTLETLERWEDAFTERKTILAQGENFHSPDHNALAKCALLTGQPKQAVEICQRILEEDSQNGMAHTILGQGVIALGNPEDGLTYLEKAVHLAPNRPESWLALASAQKSTGNNEQAEQTLLTASRAAAEAPEILLALGYAYQEQDALTKALNAFQRASIVATNSQPSLYFDISQALGDVLISLGNVEEANKVLEAAYRSRPSHTGLAHAYGKTLFKLDQPEEALAPLTMAAQHDINNPQIKFDLAQAQLAARVHLDQAQSALQDLLHIDHESALARALLAEAYEITGADKKALETYHQALGSDLAKDPSWNKTLSMGLGRVALKLDQTETALAALENTWGKNPDNPEIARMLSEAYKANRLPNKALQVAKTALQANLSDIEMVIWFAEQALEIGIPAEALSAVDKGLLLDPAKPQLHLLRGHIQLQLENISSAGESFNHIVSLEFATPSDLEIAAEGLIGIGDYSQAVTSLARAVALSKSNFTKGEHQYLQKLLTRLSQIHDANQDYQSSLEIVEEALLLSTNNTALEVSKADLLIKLDEFDRAAAWIEASLEITPGSPKLNLQAARIQRWKGNLNNAIFHAQKAVDSSDQPDKLAAIILKAELALCMMQPELAEQVLHSQSAVTSSHIDKLIAFHCLKGELALTKNAEIAAADALTAALKIGFEHPRILALRARLHQRQGNSEEAQKVLEDAMIALGYSDDTILSSPEIHLAIAEGAIELQAWDSAIHLLKSASKIVPSEPRPSAELARALVLRAEFQQLCQLLQLRNYSVGEAASSLHAFGQFEAAILSATRSLDKIRDSIIDTNYHQDFITTWLARGQAVFQPSFEHAKALTDLTPTHANKAAYLAALRASGESPHAAKTAHAICESIDEESASAELWGQVALSLLNEDKQIAHIAAQTALDKAIRVAHPNYPIFHALKAFVAQHTGKEEVQLQATQDLLVVWEKEPYWHTIAADLIIKNHDTADDSILQHAITHLEKATQLEPLKVSHYQKLGQIFLLIQDTDAAIRSLTQATNLSPKDYQPWVSLAEIYLSKNELDEAEKCANQALLLGPENPAPHLILADTALKRGHHQDSQRYVEKALHIKPGHPPALLLQAEALIKSNQHAKALTALEAATARILPSTDLLLKTVELRRHVHGEKAALVSLTNLAVQHPEDPQILVAHAQALAESGDQQGAIQVAQRALQFSGEDLSTESKANVLLILGRLVRRNGQLDLAVEHLSQAIDHLPDWVDPYIELGRTYHERRQYGQALQTFQQAIAIAPNDAQAYYQAGLTLKETKDYTNAEMMLRKASQLKPKDISIQRQLAAIVTLNLVHNPQNVLTSLKTH